MPSTLTRECGARTAIKTILLPRSSLSESGSPASKEISLRDAIDLPFRAVRVAF